MKACMIFFTEDLVLRYSKAIMIISYADLRRNFPLPNFACPTTNSCFLTTGDHAPQISTVYCLPSPISAHKNIRLNVIENCMLLNVLAVMYVCLLTDC